MAASDAELGFVPSTGSGSSAAPSAPGGNFGFVAGGGATASQPAAPAQSPLKAFFSGAANLVENNPVSHAITSLAAMPVQGAAKLMGKPDPYAGGLPGFPGSGTNMQVTSSDQPAGKYLEEEGGNALTLGSLFVPGGEAADAVTGGSGLLGAGGRVAANSALGAIQGLGGGMQAGQSAEELPGSAGMGAAIGGGLSAAGELGGALASSLASKTPESQLEAQTNRLKTLQNSFDDNTVFTKDPATGALSVKSDPIQTLSDTNLINGLKVVDGRVNTDNVSAGLQDLMAKNDAKSTELVQGMEGGVALKDFKDDVVDAVKSNAQIRDSGKLPQALAEVERRFGSYTQSFATMGDDGKVVDDSIPYPTLNNIRIAMNREFDPETRDVARVIGDTARGLLYDEDTGSPELQQIMSKQGDLLKAQNFVDKLRGTTVKGGRLGKYIADLGAGVVGSTVGGAIGGPVGAAIAAPASALAADKLVGMAQGNYFSPVAARAARSVQDLAASPAAQGAFTIGKGMLIPSSVQH